MSECASRRGRGEEDELTRLSAREYVKFEYMG